MTSPLRKKHRITRRNTPEASPADLRRFDAVVGNDDPLMSSTDAGDSLFVIRNSSYSYDNSTWLPAALLATLVVLASALQAFGGEPQHLQWRPAFAKPRTTAPVPVAQKPAANRQVAHRAATPQANDHRYPVRQVAYNEPSWDAAPGVPQGSARMETLVIHPRDPQFEGTGPAHRIAQDPFGNDDLDDELSRDINLPFGDQRVPEELPELDGEQLEPTRPELPDEMFDDMTDDMTDDEMVDELDQFDDDTTDELLDDQNMFDDTQDLPSDDEATLQQGRPVDEGPIGTFDTVPRSSDQQPQTSDQPAMNSRAQQKFEEERRKSAESCEDAVERARQDKISSIDLGIRVTGREGWDYPFECDFDNNSVYEGRHWPEVTYMWKAAANCHKPLYFEQHHLERYGHSWGPCIQPLMSGAHFFTRLPVLPYCMGITPPNECIYPLGYYRPGNCAPYMIDPVPFSWRAALFQAGATVGTAAFLP